MSRTFARLALAAAVFACGAATRTAPAEASMRRHTHLIRSSPANNDSLKASPRDLRFTFEGKIDLKVSTVHVAGARGVVVTLGKLVIVDVGSDAMLIAPIEKALAPGSYTVTWATASMHGHGAKGKLHFTIRPAAAKAG